jgi:hypothetical protein
VFIVVVYFLINSVQKLGYTLICGVKTIILLVVLCGCETWSLTLREEHRLGVFNNKVLWRVFGPKQEEMMGGWRRLHNEEPCNLYTSPYVIRVIKSRRMRGVALVACMGEMRNACKILVRRLK